MKIIAMIPARYAASRFPGKLMQDLQGKPVIQKNLRSSCKNWLFQEVYVVTDSTTIYDTITNIGGKAIMSIKQHECGSDRIAEAVESMDVDIIVNVQGDEPFTDRESLASVIEVFKDDVKKEIDLASLMTRITDWVEINDPNTVKVIVIIRILPFIFPGPQYHIPDQGSWTYLILSTKEFMPLGKVR
eukprot:TRINITY_DN8820_c0_g1_i1.p1 TRINITY_DN8820_c0_g1~~TRINITY_DN8820_c0_g1_i1.p1  ORF type:complete len:187 (-),score=24.22 TRINITY_DN8820_c0_g1_i1:189-749(-)